MSSVRRPHGRLSSVSEAVVRTWQRTHVITGRPKGSSVAFGDEMDIISQVRRHLTAQCLAHQTGEFELHSPSNRKVTRPVTFPAAQHHRPLAGTKSCCLVTEAHGC